MVLDTSACLDLVLDTEAGRTVRERLLDPQPDLLAPGLLWGEVGRVLRAKANDGALSPARAEGALADFLDLGVQEMPTEPLLVRSWEFRHNLTIDDGVFVALAEVAAQPLFTTDLKLAGAARSHSRAAVVTHLDG